MRKITALYFFLFTLMTFAQNYSGPESAEFDYANNRWLIANTTSHEVLARSSAGVLTVFATGLVSGPYGIEIVDDILYCCSGASVKGYSLTTGANVFNLNVGASFLNGMTHDNSGNLYATDFSAKKIIKINIAAQTFSTIATSLVQSPNGIVFDQANNRCVFVNWGSNGPIKAIDLTTNMVTTVLSTANANCDGITRDAIGNYYVSTWGGQNVIKYDAAFANTPAVVAAGLSSPADIFYNTATNVLAIPNSGNNTVTYLDLTLATAEFNWLKSVSVYPNPAQAEAFVKFEIGTPMAISYQILSTDGKIVNANSVAEYQTNGIITVDTSKLKTGLYFLRFTANENAKTIPLLISN